MVLLDGGMGDRAAVGVGVDEQDLAAAGGRLERQIDGHGGPSRPALRSPHRGQDPPRSTVRRDRGHLGRRGVAGEIRFGVGLAGQGGPGPFHQCLRRVRVRGDLQQPQLAEPALAVLVGGRGHPDHGQAGPGQPGQGVAVQPAGPGGDQGHLGLAGGGHRQQVTQVIAAVQHLRGAEAARRDGRQRNTPAIRRDQSFRGVPGQKDEHELS